MATMSSYFPAMLDKKAFLASYKVPKMATMSSDSPPTSSSDDAPPPALSAVAVYEATGGGRGQVEVVRAVIEAADRLG
jgi:hypothetical protein